MSRAAAPANAISLPTCCDRAMLVPRRALILAGLGELSVSTAPYRCRGNASRRLQLLTAELRFFGSFVHPHSFKLPDFKRRNVRVPLPPPRLFGI